MTDTSLPPWYYQSTTPVVTDWANVVSFSPEMYFTPKTLDELQAFLSNFLADSRPGKSLRFLGGLHSASNIFESDTVIDTSRLPLEFSVSPRPGGGQSVVASAFMHAHDFLARAAQYNLSLTALGGTDAQTLAGLISTNTAGATIHHSVYETVDWVEYLTVSPDGKSIVMKRTTSADPAFAAVICSLGVMGFLTRVGFNLITQTFYQATVGIKKLDDVLGDVVKTSAEWNFWRIEWLPKSTTQGLFWGTNQISAPSDPNGDYPPDTTESYLKLAMHADEFMFKNGPFLNLPLELMYTVLADTYSTTTAEGPMRNMIPYDRLATLKVAMAEWSFRPSDLQQVMGICRTYFDAHEWPNLPTEIECTRTDSYMMSPWNWSGLPFIVKFNFQYLTDFLTPADKATMVDHLRGLWGALEAAGVPFKAHWGKLNFLTPETVAKKYDLAGLLPHIQPTFLNAYIRERLITGAAPGQ